VRDYVATILMARGDEAVSLPFEPEQATDALETIHRALNDSDPFYRYDFAVHDVNDSPSGLPSVMSPSGSVASVTTARGSQAVTFTVFPKIADALTERPIAGKFTLTLDPTSEHFEAIADFLTFGTDLVDAPVESLAVEMPGGLGASEVSAFITTRSRQRDRAFPGLTLMIHNASTSDILASANIEVLQSTTGIRGGLSVTGTETGGCFDFSLKFHPDGPPTYDFTVQDLSGVPPADLRAGLRFLQTFQPERTFSIAIKNGPELAGPQPISVGFPNQDRYAQIERICEALSAIQLRTPHRIETPDWDTLMMTEAEKLLQLELLLAGERLTGSWTSLSVEMNAGAELPERGVGRNPKTQLAVEDSGDAQEDRSGPFTRISRSLHTGPEAPGYAGFSVRSSPSSATESVSHTSDRNRTFGGNAPSSGVDPEYPSDVADLLRLEPRATTSLIASDHNH